MMRRLYEKLTKILDWIQISNKYNYFVIYYNIFVIFIYNSLIF